MDVSFILSEMEAMDGTVMNRGTTRSDSLLNRVSLNVITITTVRSIAPHFTDK